MNEIISLNKAKLNCKYIVDNIGLDDSFIQRMYDIGLIEDTLIEPVFKGPFLDPTAYLIRGSIFAIRDTDACKIMVRRI